MSELQLLRQFLTRKNDLSNEFDSPSVKLKVDLCDAICTMAERALPKGLAPTRNVVAEIIADKIELITRGDGNYEAYMKEAIYDTALDVIDRQHCFFRLGFLVRLALTFDIKVNVEVPL